MTIIKSRQYKIYSFFGFNNMIDHIEKRQRKSGRRRIFKAINEFQIRSDEIMAKIESKEHPHEELIKGVNEQLKEVLNESKQAIYVYLDDHHMTYNLNIGAFGHYE